jgi:hypothetical protein
MKSLVAMVLGVFVATFLCLPAHSASAPVTIEAVTVEPPNPTPGSFCRLSVRLKNAGTLPATSFHFQVKIDGEELAIYKRIEYWVTVEPGTTGILDLNNFSSPSAARATFPVAVTLTEAKWAEVKRDGKKTSIMPIGPVEGLPVSSRLTVNAAPAPR